MLSSVPADLRVSVTRSFDGRLATQLFDTAFVPAPGGSIDEIAVVQMVSNFHDKFQAQNGTRFEDFPVEGVTYRVQAVVESDEKVQFPEIGTREPQSLLQPDRMTKLRYLYEEDVEVPVYQRSALCNGDVLNGPAIIMEELSTTHLCPGQQLIVGRYGELIITNIEDGAM